MSSKGSREKDALPEETKSLNGHLEKAHSEEKSLPKTTRIIEFLILACTYCLDSYFIAQV